MVKPTRYVPDAGEIVWINFTPQAGHRASWIPSGARFESGGVQRQDGFDDLVSTDDADQKLSV